MAKHPELTDEFLHVPGYIQAGDPGAIGAGKLWTDTSLGPGAWVLKQRNASDTGWEILSGGGGGGVTVFTALTDTPAAYVGQAGNVVAVNVGETALEFVAPGGGGAFLPLAGGIMTGPIQFSDAEEGIEFNDGAGVYFNGIKFDPTAPEIVIGEEAPDVGGHPPIRTNSVILRVGEGAGTGIGVIEMWSEVGAGWITVMSAITDNLGDPFEVGHVDGAFNILGSETRPTYNSAELALLSDVGGGGDTRFDIPHYNPWTGKPIRAVLAQSVVYVQGSAGDILDLVVGTVLRAFSDGTDRTGLEPGEEFTKYNPPTVSIGIEDQGIPGNIIWSPWSQNVWANGVPWDVDLAGGPGMVIIVWVAVSDGWSMSIAETAVVLTESSPPVFPSFP